MGIVSELEKSFITMRLSGGRINKARKAGYATVMTIPPNVKYQDRFLKAYKQARERKSGLWRE